MCANLLGPNKDQKMKMDLIKRIFFAISQVPIMFFSRSTKLVIIERLLLLAERYVITIEVIPIPFTSP